MKEKVIDRFVSVKTIVTVALTVTFVFLAVKGTIDPVQVVASFSSVLGFYFGTQQDKKEVK